MAREVGNPAGGEDERRIFAVQVGELGFELDDLMVVPEMLRVPPAPAPCARAALTDASITSGWPPMPR